MSDHNETFVQSTNELIDLYRGLERRASALPFISAMPLLISIWNVLKFEFFLIVGLLLIIPVNAVIFIRNLFPGRWRYRPFFLSHLRYMWRWIFRGEAPTTPFIFIRPLFNVFVKGHFEKRLRTLREVVFLHDGLSDATRSALVGRIDVALERWKTPRFAGIFFSAVLPAIITAPSAYREFVDFMGLAGFSMPTDQVLRFFSWAAPTGVLHIVAPLLLGYLLAVPGTAFLAKRGLFVGSEPNRVCFPGGQDGSGVYGSEREILGRLGVQAREAPVDILILCAGLAVGVVILFLGWESHMNWYIWMDSLQRSVDPSLPPLDRESVSFQILVSNIVTTGILAGLIGIAAFRRGRKGRI